MPEALHIASSLRDERIFVTGATGFLGKVLVEKLLWSIPEIGKLLLLIRPSSDRDASERLAAEVLASPLMARLRALHGSTWSSFAASKIDVVVGDIGQDHFGLDAEAYATLCDGVDRVVASAATVTFDERLDRALALNTRGALRSLELARDAGNVPLLHVSTCYVSAQQKGSIAETLVKIGDDTFDLDATLSTLDQVCDDLAADNGGSSDGVMSDDATHDDVTHDDATQDSPFVAAGKAQAARLGFNDVYTLTKALGERLITRQRGSVPLAILRPATVESMAEEPIPGWIEDIRVSDPLLVAYGRGRTQELPGAADIPLELIPVDYVAHAMLAALADLQKIHHDDRIPDAPKAEVRIYQVGSSRHPITLGELMAFAREGFARTPLRDDLGAPISVPEARFVETETLRRQLVARRRRLRSLARGLAAVGSSRYAKRLGVGERLLDHFIHLIDVYRPYLSHGARYQDDATQRLWSRLSTAEKATFPFDVATLDWRTYISRLHIPGLIRYALKAENGAPVAPQPLASLAERQAEAETHAAQATTLFELFQSVARAHCDTPALQICRQGHWLRYTYGQALTTTANMAWRLATEHSIGPGDRVVLWASGSPEWVLATLAVHRLGAVIVPIDPQWPVAEVVQAARLVGAKLLCAAPSRLVELGETPEGPGCPIVALAEPFVPAPEVGVLDVANVLESTTVASKGSDLASILFTSGTTVAPKAVALTHINYLANVRDLVPLMHLSRERLLSVLPIHHVFEQMVGLFVPLTGASTISYVAEVKPAEINWMMATTRPTVLVAVPRLLELLHAGIFRSIEAGGPMLGRVFKVLFALSRLTGGRYGHRLFAKVHAKFGGTLRRIATGGSALRPSLGRSFQLMGFQVAEGYGMTETSPCLTVNPWQEIRFGSAGRPLPGVEIDLRPPTDAVGVAPGSGEIWVRGDNVMGGYFENPEATAAVLQDGWLNTGDIGYFEDGYLYLSGRSKDVIVTEAGKNVYPEEVELRYRGIPDIQELIVLGLPSSNEGQGERVVALVVPTPGATEDEVEGIRSAIAERSAEIPSYQQVTRIEIWRGELPKTTTMKVKRGLLRNAVLAGERGDGKAPAPPPAAPEEAFNEAEAWVVDTLARLVGRRPDQLRAADRLADLGVDSLTRVELVAAFEARFVKRLDDSTAASLQRLQDLFELI